MQDEIVIDGEMAVRLATLWNLDHNDKCKFSFTLEEDRKWIGFDGGFDYNDDGYTYETEWPIPNNLKETILFLNTLKGKDE
jgi:hypothetical protein